MTAQNWGVKTQNCVLMNKMTTGKNDGSLGLHEIVQSVSSKMSRPIWDGVCKWRVDSIDICKH
jgi:hypothetical protein